MRSFASSSFAGSSPRRFQAGILSSRSSRSLVLNMADSVPDACTFQHGASSLTRFPPNVEVIRVEVAGPTAWLVARRNDVEMRFPLAGQDCRFLAGQLQAAGDAIGDRA